MSEPLPEHFASREQFEGAVTAGMWVFLATEAMIFGALFMAYAAYRIWFPADFAAASGRLHVGLGTLNTAIMLASSLAMTLAERAGQLRRRGAALVLLAITALLGAVFLGIKLYEWHLEAAEQLLPLRGLPFAAPEGVGAGFRAFFNLYYTVTGLHAVHLGVGLGIVAAMWLQAWRWRQPEQLARRLTVAALYWHFVDVVWVFLYPVLYLV